MDKKIVTLLVLAVLGVQLAMAQSNNQSNSLRDEFNKFRNDTKKEYEDFRKKALKEYSDFVRKAWKEFKGEPGLEEPKLEEIGPEMAPTAEEDDSIAKYEFVLQKASEEDETETAAFLGISFRKAKDRVASMKTKRDEKLKKWRQQQAPQQPAATTQPAASNNGQTQMSVREAVKVKRDNTPQPQPLAPVQETTGSNQQYYSFSSFGTDYKVRLGDDCKFRLKGVSENNVADGIDHLADKRYDNLLYDCLQLRKQHNLGDWAYYLMLKDLTDGFCGKGTNEATLLLAFLYSQSGYKMRMATSNGKLYMLSASRHTIYTYDYFNLDGEKFYMLEKPTPSSMHICEASFPKESSMSLQMNMAQSLAQTPTAERTVTSRRYPDFSFSMRSNKNLLDFFNTYPSSSVGGNIMTKWAMYANTPLDKELCAQLYPPLQAKLKGLSELEAVERLLNWVQTGFVYEYDDKVWGYDRAFFGEETIFYPYCDCEDRAILLSHLVRDLLHLPVILIYYPNPGHLSMAVGFNEDVAGDVYTVGGKKYISCDPTYIGARVGQTMKYYVGLNKLASTTYRQDPKAPTVILLED